MSISHSAEGEVDYFASMTDMMVGVLFVFIIMVAYFAFQVSSEDNVPISLYEAEQEKNKALQNHNEELKQHIKTLMAEIERLKKPDPVAEYVAKTAKRVDILVDDVVEQLKASGIDADSRRKGVVTISGKGLFAAGHSDLNSLPEAHQRVGNLAQVLLQNISCFTINPAISNLEYKKCNPDLLFLESVYIEGHTDNIPIKIRLSDGSRNNLELSSKRATNTYLSMAINQPLLTGLINPDHEQVLSVAAYGEQRPIADNATWQGRQDNRRIDIRFEPQVFNNKESLARFKQSFEEPQP